MNKNIFFSIVFIYMNLLLNSQNTMSVVPSKPVNIGIKAGLNLNYMSTDIPDFTSQGYIAFNGGVFARFNIKRLYIQPEASFSMVGGEGFFNGGGSYSFKSNQIEFPLSVGYKIIDFKIINVRLGGGPFGAVVLTNDIVVIDPLNQNMDAAEFTDWNLGLFGGLGIDIWKFTFDARYKYGFINMIGNNVMVQKQDGGFRNGHLELTVGFKFL